MGDGSRTPRGSVAARAFVAALVRLRRVPATAALVLSAAIVVSAPARAQTITTGEAIERLFVEGAVDPAWFAESFLAQIPAQQIALVLAQIVDEVGPFVEAIGTGNSINVRFEHAEMDTQIALDAEGRIIGLLFGPAVPIGGDIDTFIEQLAALPGDVSVAVLTNGDIEAGYQPELALAVASAFKLAVLAVLTEEVNAGTRSLDDVVVLDPAWRSWPTGILQDWPSTPVTLATLANLMISMSDNTATDALIHILGRDRVEERAGQNTPLLTTGELFRLKSFGNEALMDAWIAGDEAARRALITQLADIPLGAVDMMRPDPMLDVEWYFNGLEICALLEETAGAPAFGINPGLARRGDWASVAFKGGSDSGIINASTFVVAEDGTTHCVVATWNNTATLNDQAMFGPYAGILRALAAQ